MRTTQSTPALVIVGLMLTATASFGQLRREARETDPGACEVLVNTIERHFGAMEGGLDRLSQLARLGTREDRERIARIREEFGTKRDEMRERYGRAVADVDFSCNECVIRACRRIRPGLVELRDRLGVALRDLGEAETRIRQAIATGKRVGHAIRVTDRAVLRAAQLAKKTDNGEEAFPGLRRAFELQEEAKQALAAGRFEAAMKMTLRARDLIGRTVRAALDSADVAAVRKRAREYWRQTRKMIERLESRIDSENNAKAARLLAMAGQEQERARELAEEHPYRAVRHARAARRIVNEMAAFHRRAQHCEDRADRLGERIEQAEDLIDDADNERAARLLEKGAGHFERGAELCEKGNGAKATAQLDIAAKLVAKAVDVAKGNTPATHALDREIRKTGLIVKRAGRVAETDRQKEAVERAGRLVEDAKEKQDNARASLRLLDKATDIAFAVIAGAGRTEDEESDR